MTFARTTHTGQTGQRSGSNKRNAVKVAAGERLAGAPANTALLNPERRPEFPIGLRKDALPRTKTGSLNPDIFG